MFPNHGGMSPKLCSETYILDFWLRLLDRCFFGKSNSQVFGGSFNHQQMSCFSGVPKVIGNIIKAEIDKVQNQ